jgi:hypothetical protein
MPGKSHLTVSGDANRGGAETAHGDTRLVEGGHT